MPRKSRSARSSVVGLRLRGADPRLALGDDAAAIARADGHRLPDRQAAADGAAARPATNFLMGYIRFAHFAAGLRLRGGLRRCGCTGPSSATTTRARCSSLPLFSRRVLDAASDHATCCATCSSTSEPGQLRRATTRWRGWRMFFMCFARRCRCSCWSPASRCTARALGMRLVGRRPVRLGASRWSATASRTCTPSTGSAMWDLVIFITMATSTRRCARTSSAKADDASARWSSGWRTFKD
ncbi:MAG: hypothetical protein MZW92_57525 [Comamonadaceae bacterium]|nr:hypothetical protein [Comamonadaceae bacterium]